MVSPALAAWLEDFELMSMFEGVQGALKLFLFVFLGAKDVRLPAVQPPV